MKIFISTPMKTLDTNVITERIGKVQRHIKASLPEAEFIDTLIKPSLSVVGDNVAIDCLGQAIALMAEADLVFFATGWQEARGCVIEHEVAMKYGKFIVELNNEL